LAGAKKRIAEIEKAMGAEGFWDDRERSKKLMAEFKRLKSRVEPLSQVEKALEEGEVLVELGREAGDVQEVESDLEETVSRAEALLDKVEFQLMLGGEHDLKNAFLSVHAGAGGVEACDWAEMLLRMYLRWAERQGFQAEMVDVLPGEEAGIRNATVQIKGDYAYGYLKAEAGVHRLVRISPFDAASRRHTSFAAVEVIPEFDDDDEIEILDKDLRIDTYRASGAGGQHVNKTESAVRITHIPTGIVVTCQNERSQHKNRAVALRVLKARLFQRQQMEKEEEIRALYGDKGEIAWGNQIRSYVLAPYQLVKDLRTGFETGNTQAVLDGDIQGFIEAYLKGVRRQKK